MMNISNNVLPDFMPYKFYSLFSKHGIVKDLVKAIFPHAVYLK